MKNIFRVNKGLKIFFVLVFVQIFALSASAQSGASKTQADTPAPAAQTALPQVTQIDGAALGSLLKPNGKPVLINFWATWCGPCVEEFPELVKIDADYGEKLDVKAVSLDDVEELNAAVPKFLAKVKSEIPAYLLKASDEDAAIQSVSKSWTGALPFTILINADGTVAYTRQGIINPKELRAEIEKSLAQ